MKRKIQKYLDIPYENCMYSLIEINNRVIASGDWNGFLILWSLEDGSVISRLNLKKRIESVLLYNKNILCCGTSEGDCLMIVDISDISKPYLINVTEVFDIRRFGCMTKVNEKIVAGSDNGKIYIFKKEKENFIVERFFNAHNGIVECICTISYDLIASGGYDKTAHIWRVSTGEHIKSLHGFDKMVDCVKRLNNNHIVVADRSNKISVWSIERKKIRSFRR